MEQSNLPQLLKKNNIEGVFFSSRYSALVSDQPAADLPCFIAEKMSGSTASNSTANVNSPLTLSVVDAQTSAENGRKFTKYKVSVNHGGREWEIWRRYKEFNTLNEKVSAGRLKDCCSLCLWCLAASCAFGSEITRSSNSR